MCVLPHVAMVQPILTSEKTLAEKEDHLERPTGQGGGKPEAVTTTKKRGSINLEKWARTERMVPEIL